MSSTGEAVLPQVGEFEPLRKVISSQPSSQRVAQIGQGGNLVSIPNMPTENACFVAAEVVVSGRETSEPVFRAVGSEEAAPKRSMAGAWMKTALAFSLIANVALLAACAHQQTVKTAEVIQTTPPSQNISTVHKSHVEAKVEKRWVDAANPRSGGLLSALKKRLAADSTPKKEVEVAAVAPKPEPSIEPSKKFSDKLRDLQSGLRSEPVTIVHVGDSHIASDSFTRGIRRGLQKAYGDAGRGAIVPANAYKYAIADGVSMTTTGSWRAENSLRVKTGPYGLSGVRVSSSSTGATMKLRVKGEAFDWAEVTVLTGPKQGKVRISAGGQSQTFNARSGKTGSHVVRVNARGTNARVTPAGGGRTTVLNWATGRETPGIRYVNFGIISATAYLTKRWDNDLIQNDIKHLKPDLVVFGYGTNEGFNDNLNIASYKKHVQSFVDTVSAAAPETEWLFLGPASGARKSGKAAHRCGSWRVPQKLGAVRTALETLAHENDGYYWSWANAMGGPCAIDRWAKASPKLAAGDRVHLTQAGYNRSADALVKHIRALAEKPQLVALQFSGQ